MWLFFWVEIPGQARNDGWVGGRLLTLLMPMVLAPIDTSYPSLRVEREEESFITICLKDKNVNNPGYRPGNNVTNKLNPEVG